MKPDTRNPMKFFEERLEYGRKQMLSAMAEAVGESRLAADEAAQLTEDGRAGLLRLLQVWSGTQPEEEPQELEGYGTELLADVLAQLYAFFTRCPIHCPMGLALYAELEYMMASLMLGEWFE